jgi:hypothetical protein
VPGGLPPGICDLRCEVIERGGRHLRARAEALVTVTDPRARPANATSISANRLLMVDGKPFFPIGFYILSTLTTVFPADRPYQWQGGEQYPDYYLPILDRLSKSHFNCVIDYGSAAGGIEQARAFMDAAQERGIHTIFSVKDLMKGAFWEIYTKNLPTKDLREANRLLVRTFREHPSLIAWYINDEVFTPDAWQGAVDVFRDTRETDPWHPTYAVHYDYKGLGTYRSACDVIGTDPYTLSGDIGFTARSWHDARQIIGTTQPFWAVVQCFGAGYETSNPAETREPTYDEERAATLAAVAEGATGIIYYCWHSLERSPRFAERFAELDRIAAEVQSLLPVIALPDAADPILVAKGADVSVLSKQGAGRLHALVVSTSRSDQEVVLELPRAPRSVEVAGTGERLRASGRLLTLDLPALGVRQLVVLEGPNASAQRA